MKKLAAIIIAICTFTACNNDNYYLIGGGGDNYYPGYYYATDNDRIIDGYIADNMLFYGISTVETISGPDAGTVYVDEDAFFEIAPNYTATVNMFMHETRFAPTMPALEMVVPNIPYSGFGNAAAIASSIIIPQVGGTPYQRYTITELAGNIDGVYFTTSFICAGMFRVTYEGRMVNYMQPEALSKNAGLVKAK